ncbi:hypothetical protein ACFY3G_18240 [Streptomyces phaeochromogenes]|uniref:hypothetical protein n=1 Tax=Streptomyces phaeochromogenes TaxID=1923 RepID=UPI003698CD9E
MDDAAGAIVLGCVGTFFAIYFGIGIPVLVISFVYYAVMWLLNELHQLWNAYWLYVAGSVAAIFAVAFVFTLVQMWWESYRIKVARRRATKRLGFLYEQTAKKMDELGDGAS